MKIISVPKNVLKIVTLRQNVLICTFVQGTFYVRFGCHQNTCISADLQGQMSVHCKAKNGQSKWTILWRESCAVWGNELRALQQGLSHKNSPDKSGVVGEIEAGRGEEE